ncbi:MAG: sodium:proton antiporter [Gallionellaceae bacterium]
MSPTVQIVLSLLTLLFLSILTHLMARRVRVPYTVLLVVVGFLLIPLSKLPFFSYISSFQLTPDLLFFIFLPILVFESAYNMNVRHISENIGAIAALAIVGLAISALFIAIVGYWGLGLVGGEAPFVVVLLFGVLISATDPVAILALFKEFGAPRRLALIFEGESLFNDGTALAMFVVVLASISTGFQGADSLLDGVFIFFSMLIGGGIFGLLMGEIFSRLLKFARHEHLQLTLTMISAHSTFLLAEVISQSHLLSIFGAPIHISSIIATVIASIVIGQRGRFSISPDIQKYMGHFWGYSAFVANSLVFILLGLLFTTLSVGVLDILPSLIVIILVVALARAVSVYPVIKLFNLTRWEQPIPSAWQHLMAWGSLRGALAVTMVLMIPDTLTHPDWHHAYSIKDFIMALTISCIYFTLFIKATTINSVIRRFRINELRGLERMEYLEGKAYLYAQTVLRLLSLTKRTGANKSAQEILLKKYTGLYQNAVSEFSLNAQDSREMFARVLRIHAIGMEKQVLRGLFAGGELPEAAYHRVLRKLDQQLKLLEQGKRDALDFGRWYGRRWWSRLADILKLNQRYQLDTPACQYLYYRSLVISSTRAIELLSQLAAHPQLQMFEADDVLSRIIEKYRSYQDDALSKTADLQQKHPELSEQRIRILEQDILEAQKLSLEELESCEVISPAVKSALYQELHE